MNKMWLISIAVSLMLMLSCVPTASDIDVVRQGQQVRVTSMAELKTLIEESEVVDQAKAEEFFAEAEKVLSQGEEILVAIDGESGIEMVKSGVKASAGWNPYAGLMLVGLNIAQGLGLFGLGKANITKGNALNEIVVGVDGGGEKTPALKTSLVANTSIKTKALINKIKKRVA